MAKKPVKKKLTPNQLEWEKEFTRLKKRVTEWKRKFHAIIDLPTKPERITKKDIERLKEIKWKQIPEILKKKAREEYEYRYEQKMPEVYIPAPSYTPPTEQDYFDEPDYGDSYDFGMDEEDEDPLDSRAEIEAWIAETIDTITIDADTGNSVHPPIKNYDNLTEVDGVRDTLKRLVLEAADEYDNYKEYLSYLEQNADRLNHYATLGLMGYFNPKTQFVEILYPSAVQQFATILNLDRPLDVVESKRLEEEAIVYFSFDK